MKLNLLASISLASATLAFAAEPTPPPVTANSAAIASARPELRGELSTATEKRFCLALPGTGHSEWASVGESFGKWKLAQFRDADQTLILRQEDGTELALNLSAGHVTETEVKATAAEAEAVLEKMHFAKILGAAFAPQQKALLEAAQKIAAKAGLNPDSGTAYVDYQKKAADLISSALDPQQMQSDFAQIYSSVYTKNELSGLGDFFDSPVGQAYSAKAPQVQQQLQAILIPRLKAITPQLQALAKASAPAAP